MATHSQRIADQGSHDGFGSAILNHGAPYETYFVNDTSYSACLGKTGRLCLAYSGGNPRRVDEPAAIVQIAATLHRLEYRFSHGFLRFRCAIGRTLVKLGINQNGLAMDIVAMLMQ